MKLIKIKINLKRVIFNLLAIMFLIEMFYLGYDARVTMDISKNAFDIVFIPLCFLMSIWGFYLGNTKRNVG